MKFSRLYTLLIAALFLPQGFAQNAGADSDLAAEVSKMSLEEKLGQIILPNYGLLAQSTSDKGASCPSTFMSSSVDDEIICACGLDLIAKYKLGAVLTGGGPVFSGVPPTMEYWQKINRLATLVHDNPTTYQTACGRTGANQQPDASKPPKFTDPLLLIGNDAVHGNEHVQGAVIFPHNIGLGASHDADGVKLMGQLVAQDSIVSGFNWVYAPCVANAQDIRWGRTYESFSQDPSLIKLLGSNFISGVHMTPGALESVKHFAGDGATQYGHDEGDDQFKGSKDDFWKLNGQGYDGALDVGVRNLMVSYSAIDGLGTRMHMGGKQGVILLNDFKQQFKGFAVSDWNGATRAAGVDKLNLSLDEIYAKSLNAGVDMFMIAVGDQKNPTDPNGTNDLNFSTMQEAYQAFLKLGNDPNNQARLDDAVARILKVKREIGKAPENLNLSQIQEAERKLALKLAQESLVLLKNDNNTIPLSKLGIKNVVLIGNVDDIGVQNGGWTINWQGQYGNDYFGGKNRQDAVSSGATTLLKGIQKKLPGANIYTDKTVPKDLDKNSTIAIALINEPPYAEYLGDIANSSLPDPWYAYAMGTNFNPNNLPNPQSASLVLNYTNPQLVSQLKTQGIKLVTVVYSGRPVVVDETIPDALIAAFLPGTLGGQAIADAIFGDYSFCSGANGQSNRLSFDWPKDMKEVEKQQGTLHKIGDGICPKSASNQAANAAE